MSTAGPRARTSLGELSGIVVATPSGDVDAFLGVPYAQPPAGEQRFRAPIPPVPWEGTRPAAAFGPAPMQAIDGPFNGVVPGLAISDVSEDCLTLNVWTPGEPGDDLPVLAWVYGGAFVVGGTAAPTYDGARLAAEQQVVVVSLNYRVGVFGFLDLRRFGGDAIGTVTNAGLRDQLMALSWIGEHIAAFGGDVDRITVFGESAGAGSLLHVLGAPRPPGLPRRAIVQSPGVDFTQHEDLAAAVAAQVLKRAGVASATDLAAMDAGALVAAQQAAANDLLFDVGTMPFHPVIDGDVVPATPSVAFAGGGATAVDLLIGATTEEMRLFPDIRADSVGEGELRRWLRAGLHRRAAAEPTDDAVADLYGTYVARAAGTTRAGGSDVWAALQTDGTMRLPIERIAAWHAERGGATFTYQFAWQSHHAERDTAAEPSGDAAIQHSALRSAAKQPIDDRHADQSQHTPRKPTGAFHAIDLPFVFDTFDTTGWADFLGLDDHGRAVGRMLRDAWAAFAATGNPSCPALGTWPAYDTARRSTMILDTDPAVVDDPLAAERGWWDGLWSPACLPPAVPI